MNKFKLIVLGTLVLFMGMLGFVTFTAYSRKSGNTGLDMGKIHLMRRPVSENQSPLADRSPILKPPQ